jgi:senataxin
MSGNFVDDFHREILSWNFFDLVAGKDQIPVLSKKSDWVSELLGQKSALIPERFLSDSDYKQAFFRPALLEFQASLISSMDLDSRKPFPVRISSSGPSTETDLITVTISWDKEFSQQITSDLLFVLLDSGESLKKVTASCLGLTVYPRISSVSVKAQIGKSKLNGKKGLFLLPLMNIISATRELAALDSLSQIPLKDEILLGSGDCDALYPYTVGEDPNHRELLLPAGLRASFERKLNSSQIAAVLMATSQNHPKISLIQGPPGTGKTQVLHVMSNVLHFQMFQAYYDAVAEMVRLGKMSANEKDWLQLTELKPRLLLCAPSNVAIDHIVNKILVSEGGFLDGEGRKYTPSLVRVGKGGQGQGGQGQGVHGKFSLDRIIEKITGKTAAQLTDKIGKEMTKLANNRLNVLEARAKLMCLSAGTPYVFRQGIETRITGQAQPGVYRAYWVDHNRRITSNEMPPPMGPNDLRGLTVLDMPEWQLYVRELMANLELWEESYWKIQRMKLAYQNWQSGNPDSPAFKENLEALVLNRATIVAGTLNSAGLPQMKQTYKFKTLIVDEAAQAVELSTLIPLSLGVHQCVLIGDPQQLPATILSKREDMGNYERSLFERLQQCGVPLITLSVQYRMHPAISLFPRVVFYDSKSLEDSVSSTNIRPSFFSKPEYGIEPFTFFDLPSTENNSFTLSRSNPIEAQFCVNLFLSLWHIAILEGVDLTGKVGIITPYQDQLKLIKQALDKALPGLQVYNSEVEVNTVDAFQGKEKDIIIVSTVRASNPADKNSSIGFLADIRRMNVALTRAKQGLFVVGRNDALKVNPYWSMLVDQAKSLRNAYLLVRNLEDDVFGLYSHAQKKPSKKHPNQIHYHTPNVNKGNNSANKAQSLTIIAKMFQENRNSHKSQNFIEN